MADFPSSAVDYIDTEVYTYAGSFGSESLMFIDPGAVPVLAPAPAPPAGTIVLGSSFLESQFATELGVDVSCYPDLSASFALVSQKRAVAEMAYRRLTTERGSLSFHPDAGRDLRYFLGESVTDARLFALREQIESELIRDERVEKAVAKLDFDSQSGALTVTIDLYTAEGPFALTIRVTQLTIELLENAP